MLTCPFGKDSLNGRFCREKVCNKLRRSEGSAPYKMDPPTSLVLVTRLLILPQKLCLSQRQGFGCFANLHAQTIWNTLHFPKLFSTTLLPIKALKGYRAWVVFCVSLFSSSETLSLWKKSCTKTEGNYMRQPVKYTFFPTCVQTNLRKVTTGKTPRFISVANIAFPGE